MLLWPNNNSNVSHNVMCISVIIKTVFVPYHNVLYVTVVMCYSFYLPPQPWLYYCFRHLPMENGGKPHPISVALFNDTFVYIFTLNHQRLWVSSLSPAILAQLGISQFWCIISGILGHETIVIDYMGQVTKLWLSCYLVLLSIDSKTR